MTVFFTHTVRRNTYNYNTGCTSLSIQGGA